jgi:hypothetical protein
MAIAEVIAAFKKVFDDGDIRQITPNAYSYDIIEDSELDSRKFRHKQDVNFFVYLVTKSVERKAFGCELEQYNIEIKYYRKDDKEGIAQNEIKQNFELVYSKIKSLIGNTLDGSVDYFLTNNNFINLSTITLDGGVVWLGSFNLIGFKTI